MNLNHKLVLGTVQFGLNYGFQQVGQVPYEEVSRILDYAATHGISTLDTATMYGESEEVLGNYLQQASHRFNLISKIKTADLEEADLLFKATLRKLGATQLYGYLIHRFDEYRQTPATYDFMNEQKQEGTIKKIGFSLYFPQELEYLLEHEVAFDLLQFPFSIFDQRFKPYFKILKEKKVEIHVRSVFLQGILLENPSALPSHFDSVKNKLDELRKLAANKKIPLSALTLNFAHLQPEIDGVVIGVHTLEQLKENIASLEYQTPVAKLYSELESFKEEDEQITVPLNWKV